MIGINAYIEMSKAGMTITLLIWVNVTRSGKEKGTEKQKQDASVEGHGVRQFR